MAVLIGLMLTTKLSRFWDILMLSGKKVGRPGRKATESAQEKVRRAAEIFEQYGDLIRSMILFNVNDELEADDIFQDFFLSLVRKPVPPTVKDIKGYLYRAILNDVLDSARRVKSYKVRLHRYAEYVKDVQVQQGPEGVLARAEQVQRVLRLVEEHLPPHQAQAVSHRYCDGRSMHEAAKKMTVTERTVSRYICMGLKKIRCLLCENETNSDQDSRRG